MTGVFDHPWLSGLFADDEIAALWSAEAQLSSMMAFEAAWSRHGHLAGLWSEKDGASAASAIRQVMLAPVALREGTAQDGVCVPALVQLLKQRTGSDAIHKGATSQDVIDTATVLSLVQSLDVLDQRVRLLLNNLSDLKGRFGGVTMMGRTRMQAAMPISVADRIETWRLPLLAHHDRLSQLRPRVALVQIGGAAGDRAALGDAADVLGAAVAQDLGLSSTSRSWHATRDGMAEAASVLSLITGSLGKMGQDICLMAQQGIDEITLAGGGGSSAMPHKQNPVLAELLVTLARFNATQVSGMHSAMIHEQERSGAAWSLEWMLLPQMAQATGRALNVAKSLVAQIEHIGTSDQLS
ncbi:3-carboxy-cis,cis-muconate cycloisomerase [Marivita sp. XM-24bin2]|jgi:3-carboxy-cis,cis-muconate cycloisomerase|uniref:3-carboxy-cis,cis-muconate cycloisomerase n=1 Tax=unclassified Marivita TaxID=2632480 RepID=UPI0025BD0308|nr:3-carboxy-cis,cis-muconate cycloisomerase [Marivita sp. XM-24bin2]MCR9108942.1 3-carboxy-cis,cis-muconate cycloisomerase [Paracoccaceae bacterium]